MYMNKQTRKALDVLTLRLKVVSKEHGASEQDSAEWHDTWNRAQSAHHAIRLVLGTGQGDIAAVNDGDKRTLKAHGIEV